MVLCTFRCSKHYLMAGEENVSSKSEEDLDDLFMTFPGCLHDGSPPSLENDMYEHKK